MFLYIINLSTKESPHDVLSLASGVRAEDSAQQGNKVNKGPFYSWVQGAYTWNTHKWASYKGGVKFWWT